MTLLDDLEEVAREIDCPISDLCTAEDNCTRRPLAARLRVHAARLRKELKARKTVAIRINGGPVKP